MLIFLEFYEKEQDNETVLLRKWDKLQKKVLANLDIIQPKAGVFKINTLEDPLRRRLFTTITKEKSLKAQFNSNQQFWHVLLEKKHEKTKAFYLDEDNVNNSSKKPTLFLKTLVFLEFSRETRDSCDQSSFQYKSQPQIFEDKEESPKKSVERTASSELLLRKKQAMSASSDIKAKEQSRFLSFLWPLSRKPMRYKPESYFFYTEKLSLKGALWGLLEISREGIYFKSSVKEKRPNTRPYK